MIPVFDVKIKIKVDMARVCPLPWKIIHEKDGLMENHFYQNMQGIDWKDFEFIFSTENNAIKFLDSQTKDSKEFDANVDKLEEDSEWEELNALPGVDLGVASVVAALYAFGCFPMTSCRGHPPPCGERHPLVIFFAKRKVVPIIVGVAAGTGVGLCDAACAGEEGLMVYATNIVDMQRFAVGLYRAFPSVTLSERKKR
jgi:hypothetical protein